MEQRYAFFRKLSDALIIVSLIGVFFFMVIPAVGAVLNRILS